MNPADFLTALWGPAPPGLIQIWELDGRRSGYYQSPAGTAGLAGQTDVYTAVSLAHKNHGRGKRAKADQAIALAGLWLDLDVNGGPDKKTGAIATADQAAELAHTFTAPTLLVHSGYGLHAWYLFDEPWRFVSRDEQQQAARAAAQWYALHRAAALEHGWGLDHTHDLARLLRLPGTFNGKGQQRQPVQLVFDSGVRYPRAQLLELADQAGDVQSTVTQLALDETLPAVEPSNLDEPPIKVLALIENSPEFAAAWNHRSSPHWSLSEYDLSLCSLAAQAEGVTDQDLADLICAHRRRWDPADGKAGRLDYLQRTIRKARSGGERQAAADLLRRAAA